MPPTTTDRLSYDRGAAREQRAAEYLRQSFTLSLTHTHRVALQSGENIISSRISSSSCLQPSRLACVYSRHNLNTTHTTDECVGLDVHW